MRINNKHFACYLHIPFCREKCNYCDYYSRTYHGEYLSRYIKVLKQEIELRANISQYQGTIASIYFGGGTPSLLSSAQLTELLETLKETFGFISSYPEITLETNPADLQEKSRLKTWLKLGINRFSLGVQSLLNQELEILNRQHDEKQVLNSLEILQEQKANYNADLIYGIPQQTSASFFSTLDRLLQFSPPHISVYNLELKPGTPLKADVEKGKISEMSEDEQTKIFQNLPIRLQEEDYINYEIANYAQPGYKCQHNLYYWKSMNYLGFGPGAHGFWQGKRLYNHCNLQKYMNLLERNVLPPGECQKLSLAEKISEFMIMGLRLKKGVEIEEFNSRFPRTVFYYFADEINNLKAKDLLRQEEGRIFLSKEGRRLGNYVFRHFV